jgi:hypothetical protein
MGLIREGGTTDLENDHTIVKVGGLSGRRPAFPTLRFVSIAVRLTGAF